jgi:hypothetical protein
MAKPSGSPARFNYLIFEIDSESSKRAAAFDAELSERF